MPGIKAGQPVKLPPYRIDAAAVAASPFVPLGAAAFVPTPAALGGYGFPLADRHDLAAPVLWTPGSILAFGGALLGTDFAAAGRAAKVPYCCIMDSFSTAPDQAVGIANGLGAVAGRTFSAGGQPYLNGVPVDAAQVTDPAKYRGGRMLVLIDYFATGDSYNTTGSANYSPNPTENAIVTALGSAFDLALASFDLVTMLVFCWPDPFWHQKRTHYESDGSSSVTEDFDGFRLELDEILPVYQGAFSSSRVHFFQLPYALETEITGVVPPLGDSGDVVERTTSQPNAAAAVAAVSSYAQSLFRDGV